MYKYELYQIDTYMSNREKLIAKSNNLEELRKYAKKHYLYPDKDFYSSEVELKNGGFFYENRSGGYHGAPYYPSAIIKVAPTDFIIIE